MEKVLQDESGFFSSFPFFCLCAGVDKAGVLSLDVNR